MSKPFSSFGPDTKRLASKMEKGAQRILAESVVAAGTRLARETPVDTGRASGNWQASVGQPILFESGTFFPNASIDQIRFLRTSATASGGNPSLFLTNMVPYMQDLNRGWSKQAPIPFWIERGVEASLHAVIASKRYKILG